MTSLAGNRPGFSVSSGCSGSSGSPVMRMALVAALALLPPIAARAADPPEASSSAAVGAHAEAAPPEPPKEPAPPHAITLDFVGHVGLSYRLGSPPAFDVIQRSGLAAGGGLVFTPVRAFGVGLDYEYVDLGRERFGDGGIGSASMTREMHTAWADLRVTPLRKSALSVFVDLGLGLAWQSANAGIISGPNDFRTPPAIITCRANDSANIALRAGVGVLVPLGEGLLFTSNLSLENARLGGELLDDCILGAGGTSTLALRAGLAYRLDLTRFFP